LLVFLFCVSLVIYLGFEIRVIYCYLKNTYYDENGVLCYRGSEKEAKKITSFVLAKIFGLYFAAVGSVLLGMIGILFFIFYFLDILFLAENINPFGWRRYIAIRAAKKAKEAELKAKETELKAKEAERHSEELNQELIVLNRLVNTGMSKKQMKYYLSKENQVSGPYTVSKIEKGIDKHIFTDDYYIIEKDFYDADKTESIWKPITERKQLLRYSEQLVYKKIFTQTISDTDNSKKETGFAGFLKKLREQL